MRAGIAEGCPPKVKNQFLLTKYNPVKDRRFTIGVFNRHGRPTEAAWLYGFVTSGFYGFWKGGVSYS